MKLSAKNPVSRRAFLQTSSALGMGAFVGTRGLAQTVTSTRVAQGQRAAVATVHPLASQAAIHALQRGGNAVDAAAAASIMLSVVDGFNSGIGGGCLALVRSSQGKVHALDGREKAPQRARPEMFFRNGKPDPKLSQLGPLAAGVPGLLAALDRLVNTHGKLKLTDAFLEAAEVAETGFEIDANYASRLGSAASALRKFPSSAAILLDERGDPWQVGHQLRQPDLAKTLRNLAEHGVDWFYQGEFAERCAQFMESSGGILQASDFANYNCVARQPIQSTYRGKKVFGFPPPSSGGIHIAQMLGMLAQFDLKELFASSEATGRHALLETMKRAMADRAYWLGDSDFAKVPKGLLDPDYLHERAKDIDLRHAVEVESHGRPPAANIDLFGSGGHTTHLTTADAEGNVVALTQTVNTTFGCKMIVPGTGVVLNNELDDFSIAPGVRNAFGLLGSEANLIAPGKRPLSSMSPSLVLNEDQSALLTCGAAGGPKIITTVLQIIVRVLDLGQSIEEAIAAPRSHHQWSPDLAVCEQALEESIVAELSDMGHETSRIRSAAVAQGIAFDRQTMTSASDPRVPSSALALS